MNINPTEFPLLESKFFLTGPVGKLEVLTNAVQNPTKNTTAIICHPHPLFGGTMHNKVIYTIAKAMKELEIKTLRFNFRGVGNSEGSYAEGIGETDDLLAVIKWVHAVRPEDSLWLAGFSFGSYVAARAASISNCKQLITVAPAVQSFNFKPIKTPQCPWLVIQGEEDEIVPPEVVYQWAAEVQPAPELIRIPGASHFFHGKLVELRQALVAAL